MQKISETRRQNRHTNVIFESVVRWMNGSNCKTDWAWDIVRYITWTDIFPSSCTIKSIYQRVREALFKQSLSVSETDLCQLEVGQAAEKENILIIDFVFFYINFIYGFHYCAPFDEVFVNYRSVFARVSHHKDTLSLSLFLFPTIIIEYTKEK